MSPSPLSSLLEPDQRSHRQSLAEPENPLQARERDLYVLPGPSLPVGPLGRQRDLHRPLRSLGVRDKRSKRGRIGECNPGEHRRGGREKRDQHRVAKRVAVRLR